MKYAQHIIALGILTLFTGTVHAQTANTERWAKVDEPGEHPTRWRRVDDGPTRLPALTLGSSYFGWLGVTALVGVPEGIAPGLSIHPGTDFLHLDAGVTGFASLGFRVGATVDPFDTFVAPTFTVSGGYSGWSTVPFAGNDEFYRTSYLNIQPGIEIGPRNQFRVFVRVGYSRLWVNTDLKTSVDGLRPASQPKIDVAFFPSVSLGITAYVGK